MSEKAYLGDAVYVEFDGYGLVLTTQRYDQGIAATSTIFLEPKVFEALLHYETALRAELARQSNPEPER